MSKKIEALIVNEKSIVIVIDTKIYTIHRNHKSFDKLAKLAQSSSPNIQKILKIVDVPTHIKISLRGSVFDYKDGVFWYNNDYKLPKAISDKLYDLYINEYDYDPLINFINNLSQNPSKTAVEELYLFLNSGNLPITQDGHFIAYKKVMDDYTDCYTRSFDNSIGQVLEMPRFAVDDNRNNTCSSGFHFCSYDYLQGFSGSRVMTVKINPRDVVSIPSDYNNTKGRTCKYEVIAEVSIASDELKDTIVYNS